MDMDWSAIALSVRLATLTTLILLVVGLPLANWLASSKRRGRWVIDALVALPLVPYQLIVPGQLRPARWVRQVVSIDVVTAPKAPTRLDLGELHPAAQRQSSPTA